jgi:hypothetical protein
LVIEEIRREIKKLLESKENVNITYQNFWDIAKAVLISEFIALSICIKKPESTNK